MKTIAVVKYHAEVVNIMSLWDFKSEKSFIFFKGNKTWNY